MLRDSGVPANNVLLLVIHFVQVEKHACQVKVIITRRRPRVHDDCWVYTTRFSHRSGCLSQLYVATIPRYFVTLASIIALFVESHIRSCHEKRWHVQHRAAYEKYAMRLKSPVGRLTHVATQGTPCNRHTRILNQMQNLGPFIIGQNNRKHTRHGDEKATMPFVSREPYLFIGTHGTSFGPRRRRTDYSGCRIQHEAISHTCY